MRSLPLALLLAACAPVALTPEAVSVRITSNPETVKGCRYLEAVEGKDDRNMRVTGSTGTDANARHRLQNNTAALKGNTVLLTYESTRTNYTLLRGEAYACSGVRP